MDSSGSVKERVAERCDNGNEPSGSTKCAKFLD